MTNFTESLPALDYTELFGIPVDVLDHLTDLREAADAGRLRYPDWVDQHATAMAPYSVDEDAIADLSGTVLEARIELDADSDPDPDLKMWLAELHSRAVAASEVPSVTDLEEYLRICHSPPASMERTMLAHSAPKYERWLREAFFDPQSGFAHDLLDELSEEDDDVLGAIVVGRHVARAKARQNATAEELEEAQMRREHPQGRSFEEGTPFELQYARSLDNALFSFLRFAARDDSPAGQRIRQVIGSGELPDLLRRFHAARESGSLDG